MVRRKAKAVWAASVEAPEPGLALEKAMIAPGSSSFGRFGLQQAAQPRHGLVLGIRIEGRIQKFARAHSQGAQNRVGIVANMQAHDVRLEVQRGHAADQLAGHIQVADQVQQNHVWLGLTQANFERLLRRIGLELRQDLEGPRALDGAAKTGWPTRGRV